MALFVIGKSNTAARLTGGLSVPLMSGGCCQTEVKLCVLKRKKSDFRQNPLVCAWPTNEPCNIT